MRFSSLDDFSSLNHNFVVPVDPIPPAPTIRTDEDNSLSCPSTPNPPRIRSCLEYRSICIRDRLSADNPGSSSTLSTTLFSVSSAFMSEGIMERRRAFSFSRRSSRSCSSWSCLDCSSLTATEEGLGSEAVMFDDTEGGIHQNVQ
jgi:hypothetical protein